MGSLANAFVKYHKGIGLIEWYWRPWMAVLFISNIVVPVVFITRHEAQVVLAVSLVNVLLFTVLTAMTGFSRLLSLAHIFWLPLVVYLWMRLPDVPSGDWYAAWLRLIIMVNAVSLVIDAVNVIRYCAGDRAEMVEGLSPRS